jgi:hypothetical protein
MKYISYSLWGNNDAYFRGLIRCIKLNNSIYPGWQSIVYYDKAIDPSWIEILNSFDLRLEACDHDQCNEWEGLYWRFKVFDLVDCEVAIIRDTDSPSTQRECKLVSKWLQSDKPLHIMRDHPAHDMPIMGGMWGFNGSLGMNIGDCISKWRWKHHKGTDQHFLRKYIYLKYWKKALIHSSFNAFCGENIEWIEPNENYIGKPFFCNDKLDIKTERKIHERPSYFKVLRSEFYYLRKMLKFAKIRK